MFSVWCLMFPCWPLSHEGYVFVTLWTPKQQCAYTIKNKWQMTNFFHPVLNIDTILWVFFLDKISRCGSIRQNQIKLIIILSLLSPTETNISAADVEKYVAFSLESAMSLFVKDASLHFACYGNACWEKLYSKNAQLFRCETQSHATL